MDIRIDRVRGDRRATASEGRRTPRASCLKGRAKPGSRRMTQWSGVCGSWERPSRRARSLSARGVRGRRCDPGRAPDLARRAIGPVEPGQRSENERRSRENPGAEARRRRARQNCAGDESGPDARQNQRAAQMGVPWSLGVGQARAPRREREMRADAAQRAGDESEAYRLRADPGEPLFMTPIAKLTTAMPKPPKEARAASGRRSPRASQRRRRRRGLRAPPASPTSSVPQTLPTKKNRIASAEADAGPKSPSAAW